MPVMGGMEASQVIRAWERETRCKRTPIVALTAHASTFQNEHINHLVLISTILVLGDRERCLKAGMDDHITSKLQQYLFHSPIADFFAFIRAIEAGRSNQCYPESCELQRLKSHHQSLEVCRYI